MANEVKLTIAGDSEAAEKALRRTGQAAEAAGKDMQSTARRFDDFSEAADTAETRAQGARDGLTGLQDSAAALGEISRGNLFEGLLLAGSGMADMASTAANFVGPALKNLVTRIGAVRLALIGTAGAAALGIGAFLLLANQSDDTGDSVENLNRDLQVLARTGRATGELARLFGNSANSAADFAHALDVLDEEFVSTRDDIFRPIGSDEQRRLFDTFQRLDGALVQQIDSGTDAAVVMERLKDAYGEQNVQTAIANGLLPQFAEATKDAADQNDALADSVQVTAAQYRNATFRLQEFADLLKAQTDPVFAYANASQRARDAQNEFNDVVDEFGPESDEARQAALDLAEAQLGVVDATSAFSQVNGPEAIKRLEELRDAGFLSGDAFVALRDAVQQGNSALDNLNGKVVDIRIREFVSRSFGSDLHLQNLGRMHDGGVVPGPVGQEVLAVLQAGERVVPLDGAGGSTVVINVGGSRYTRALVEDLARGLRQVGGLAVVVK